MGSKKATARPRPSGVTLNLWVNPMGFKTIKGRSYFYETRRVNGRHETAYVGGGKVGDLAAAAAKRRRSRRDAERRAEDATRRRWATEDAQAADLFGRVERAFRAALEGCGYRRHNRGEWRKRRAMGEAGGGRKALTNEEAMALMNRLAVPYGRRAGRTRPRGGGSETQSARRGTP